MNRLLFAGLMVAAPLALALGACSQETAPTETNKVQLPQAIAGAGAVRMAAGLDQVVQPGAVVEKVATGYKFVEGPLWRNGELWFSDLQGNTLNALGADGKTRVLMQKAGGLDSFPDGQYGGSNGMIADKDGSVLLDQHGLRRIARLDANFNATTAIDRFEGKRLNSPNDMAFHPDGSLWFTDPPYGLPGQDTDPAKEVKFNGVYRFADGKLGAAIRDLPRPNGIGFSPDGKVLYISNSGPDMFINRYDVGPGGKVSGGRRFFEFPKRGSAPPPDVPDGLKVDSTGNVWASGPGGIRVISPEGGLLGQIRVPEVAANLIFGGPDLKTLYILASTSVYRMPVLVAGQAPLYSK